MKPNEDRIKPSKKYPSMYHFKQKNGRWSKDYYGKTRALDYSRVEVVEAKVVGQLPYESTARARLRF